MIDVNAADRRQFLLALSGAASSALFSASGAAAEKLRVGINLTTIETLPIYVAAEGPLAGALELQGGALPLLTAGKFDVVTNAETQAVLRATANPEIRVIMTVAEYSYRIVARRSSGIQAVADLRGKKIATQLNSSAHFYAVKTVRSAGLSESDITAVGMKAPEMPAAITRHEVDAVAIWEPESERALRALGDDAVTFSDPESYRELYNLNTTAQALADPVRRAQITGFVRRLIAASRTATHDPAKIWPLVSAASGYPVALIGASWHHHRFPAALPADLLDVLVEEEKWLAAQNSRAPRTRAQLAPLIDRSVLQEALRGR